MSTIKLPVIVEPLLNDVTTNPNSSLTDAVTLPLEIKFEIKASSDNAALGISNNPSPLPLKNEPDVTTTLPPVTNKLPVNCAGPIFLNVLDDDTINEPVIVTFPINSEPLSILSTLNPNSGDTEAVTLPLAILTASSLNAVCGILNNPSPLPLKKPLPDGI